MQKVFHLIGILTIFFFSFLLFNLIFSKGFFLDIQGISNWAGGIGGLLFGILSFLVGGSEKTSGEVGLKISKINIFSKNAGDGSGDNSNNTTINLPK